MLAKQQKQSSLQQALKALRVYQQRTEKAYVFLSNHDIDQFIDMQKKQSIAFANFIALDHVAMSEGFDLKDSIEACELYQKVETLRLKISELIEIEQKKQKARLQKINQGRQGIKGYSSNFIDIKFKKTA
jgi:hypothetical protein